MYIRLLQITGLLTLLLITGCGSHSVQNDILHDGQKSKVKTVILEENAPQSDEDPFEELNKYAFQHYIFALMLESENPPDIAGAADHYKRALQYHPNSYQLRLSLANSYFNLHRFAETSELLTIIEPKDKIVYSLLGRSYLSLGFADSAQTAFTQLVKIDPNSALGYHYLSQLYRNNGPMDSLIWTYENLTRLVPYSDKYWQELGRLKAQVNDYESAKRAFYNSIRQKDDNTNILSYVGLAEMYRVTGQTDSALNVYKQAIAVDSDNSPLYTEVSILYAQLDSLEEAIPYARKATELTPTDKTARRRLGVIYYGVDSLSAADSVFTALVNSGEEQSINHFYLGRIAALREEYDIAVEEFKIVTQLADTVAENWLDLAFAYRKLEDTASEIQTYKHGLARVKDEQSAEKLLFTLGAAYERSNMFDSAIAIFNTLIIEKPDNHQALNYLGYMLADKGVELMRAKELIEKALELAPDNPAYLDSYGWVFYRLGEYKKAKIYLEQAAGLAKDAVIFNHLGDAYDALGDTKKAEEWRGKALELDPQLKK